VCGDGGTTLSATVSCEFSGNFHRDSIWEIPLNSSCVLDSGRHGIKPISAANREGERMEAYRIDRFGSVDGIVLRSSENPRPGPKEVLMRVRERWRSRSAEARRDPAFRRCG
jgi:hypothetical protein